jgi:hypothetical protein
VPIMLLASKVVSATKKRYDRKELT